MDHLQIHENTIFAGSEIYQELQSKGCKLYGKVLFLAGIKVIECKIAEPRSMLSNDPRIVEAMKMAEGKK